MAAGPKPPPLIESIIRVGQKLSPRPALRSPAPKVLEPAPLPATGRRVPVLRLRSPCTPVARCLQAPTDFFGHCGENAARSSLALRSMTTQPEPETQCERNQLMPPATV